MPKKYLNEISNFLSISNIFGYNILYFVFLSKPPKFIPYFSDLVTGLPSSVLCSLCADLHVNTGLVKSHALEYLDKKKKPSILARFNGWD